MRECIAFWSRRNRKPSTEMRPFRVKLFSSISIHAQVESVQKSHIRLLHLNFLSIYFHVKFDADTSITAAASPFNSLNDCHIASNGHWSAKWRMIMLKMKNTYILSRLLAFRMQTYDFSPCSFPWACDAIAVAHWNVWSILEANGK